MAQASRSGEKLSPLKQAYLALKKTEARLESLERSRREGIAILGMGCRYPGGVTDPESYWDLLSSGRDAITEVPASRWDVDAFYDPDPDAPGKISSRYGGFIDGVDQFDADFFGISPREADSLDPQQRLLLEVTYEALEHAGLAADRLVNSPTGVFVGLANGDYYCLLTRRSCAKIDAYLGTGTSPNAAAGRLSYVFGLRGPCMAVDTACSSSLVSVHLACQALRNGECDMALASGVNVMLLPDLGITFSKAHMLCPDGRCKTFDASANGYVRGEGVGVIVLKRLSDAVADGDRILAVIRGSAVNQDGPSSGLTAPNGPSQQDVIRRALALGDIQPEEIEYLEGHGTGTALGDPIEMGAVQAVFGDRPAPLWVGSVKTNIGHLEAAAGIAGVMKAVLALEHGEIPPHLHFQNPSPRIPWNNLPVRVPTKGVPWSRSERRRLAGVSSFGFSGINAHVVVEEAPSREEAAKPERPFHVLPLSARSPESLRQLAGRYAAHLQDRPEAALSDVCFTAAAGRSQFEHRVSVVAETAGDQRELVDSFVRSTQPETTPSRTDKPAAGKVAFLFSGQGAQYVGMGHQLYLTEPTFREAFDQCDELLRDHLEHPLQEVVFAEDSTRSPLHETAYTQPALFALEYALGQLWLSWGVRPSVMIGHSVGEYVAACLANVFSLADALKLVAARARLMQELPGNGCMAAVFAEEPRVREALTEVEDVVAVAAINSPRQVVISGLADAVEAVVAKLQAAGVTARRLNVSRAFHSPLVAPMLASLRRVAETIAYRRPSRRLLSNVTGGLADEGIARAAYWCDHARWPVRFSQCVTSLVSEGIDAFLEVGPQTTLLALAKSCWKESAPPASPRWLGSLSPKRHDCKSILTSLGELYMAGCEIDWSEFAKGFSGRRISLPTYPFQRRRYWAPATGFLPDLHEPGPQGRVHPLLGRRLYSAAAADLVQFESYMDSRNPRYLAEHRIAGTVVLPGAAYEEMALAAAKDVATDRQMALEDLSLDQMLRFPEDESRCVQVALQPNESAGYRFAVYSRLARSDADSGSLPWTLHAAGRVAPVAEEGEQPAVEFDELKRRCGEEVPIEGFYEQLARDGIQLGPSYQGLRGLWRGDGEVLGSVEIPASIQHEMNEHLFHPALLDACQTVAFYLVAPHLTDEQQGRSAFLPVGLERIRLYEVPGAKLWSHARMRAASNQDDSSRLVMDIDVFRPDAALVARVEGFQVREIRPADLPAREEGAAPSSRQIADELLALPADRRRDRIVEFLEEEVSKVLRLDANEKPHLQRSLFEQGMDSLMVVEFLYRINASMRANLSMQKLLETPAILPLAEQLAQQAGSSGPRPDHDKLSGESIALPQDALASDWLPYDQSEPDSQTRLLCFHPPGGDAEVYSQWPNQLHPALEVCAVQLPGSGLRKDEPPIESWPRLVETVAEEILDYMDRPFAFFGFGSGGVLALDLAHFVHERFGLSPAHLFIAAARPPSGASAEQIATAHEDEDDRGVGMVPQSPRPPSDCSITVLVAKDDERFTREDLHGWRRFTQGSFRFEELEGDQTSYLASPKQLRQIIARDVELGMGE